MMQTRIEKLNIYVIVSEQKVTKLLCFNMPNGVGNS